MSSFYSLVRALGTSLSLQYPCQSHYYYPRYCNSQVAHRAALTQFSRRIEMVHLRILIICKNPLIVQESRAIYPSYDCQTQIRIPVISFPWPRPDQRTPIP